MKKVKSSRAPEKTVALTATQKPTRAAAKKGVSLLDFPAKKEAGAFHKARKSGFQPVSAPEKAAGNVPLMNGSVIYNTSFSQSSEPVGLYKVPQSAVNSELLFLGPDASYGGVCIDDLYYATSYYELLGYVFITVDVYDVASGELVNSFEPTDVAVIARGGYTLDPSTGSVYGITYNSNGDGLQLSKLQFTEEGVTATAIGEMVGSWNSIACDATGQLYGISYILEEQGEDVVAVGSTLNKINKTTGAVTKVGDTGVTPVYISSATIDPKTNRMFWNVNPADENSYIYEVNLQTGAASLLYEIPTGDEIVGMYVVNVPEAGAPGECTNVTPHFDNGSLSGTLTMTTPAKTYGGSNGSGNITVKVYLNGTEVGSKSAAYNSQLTFNITAPAAGSYNIKVVPSNSAGNGPATTVKNYWIGSDTPEATRATLVYANGNMEVTWNAVTASVNGGYLDLSAIKYNVKRADGTYAARNLTVTSYSEAVQEPSAVTSYYYEVEVVCGDLVSAPARTNTVVLGSITPPYTFDFAADGLSGFTVIDANNDGRIWTAQTDGTVKMSYNSELDMDDWLITPPIKVEAGKSYTVSFDAWAQGSSFPERLEVLYGTDNTPDAMTRTILTPTVVRALKDDPMHVEKFITPTADGRIYIGFHGISDADMFALNIANVSISGGVAATAPAEVTNLTATPDAAGANKVKIAFNAPTKAMNGNTITSLTKVEVLRGQDVVKTFTGVSTGASLSYEDTTPAGGEYTYTVVAYNDSGAGLPANITVFVGFKEPAYPETVNIATTSNEGEVILTWDEVTTDADGRAYPAGSVKYNVYQSVNGSTVTIATGIDATSYSYQAVAAGEQDLVQCGVAAVYDSMVGLAQVSDMIPVGKPYDGLSESFADCDLHYLWGLRSIGQGSIVLLDDETFDNMTSQDGDNGYIAIKAQYLDQGASLFSGLVSLDQMVNPGLTFYTYNIVGDNPDINEISVQVREAGVTEWTEVYGPKTVNEIVGDGVDGWGKVTVNLAAYANKVIQFQITGITKQYVYTMLDNIKVGSLLDYDLAATKIEAPSKVAAGEDYSVTVTVTNDGTKAASAYSVELYKDEDLAATEELSELASGETATVIFEEAMSAVAQEPVTYYAKVVFAQDGNMTNNQTSSITVAPIVSHLPAPTELTAENVNNGIQLKWTAPDLEGGVALPVTEDFEDGEAFAAEYGEWTFADRDDSEVGGFQGIDLPGITPGGSKGSFWIWDQTDGIGNQTFDAHSGMKYLFALFRYDDGTTDDWAISPELYGGAQTISFYAKSYSSSYPEKIRVMYTKSSSTNPSDYEEVMAPKVVPGDWTLYEVELPEGATHFAINSCATGSFMLMVDDVTYTPAAANSNLELKGYNVYRDGEKINDSLVTETSYVDTAVEAGKQYTYIVTAVYAEKGESALSNEATITCGIESIGDEGVAVTVEGSEIVVVNALDRNITVVATDGAVVYSGLGELRTAIPVAKGVYVVTAANVVKKVMVK